MKKVLFVMFICLFSFSFVKAESYYTNKSGVEFSKQEYDFITNMYYEGYQENMTLESLERIRDLDLVNMPIEKVSTSSEVMPLISSYENGRTLSMVKSCSSQCLVALTATWNGTPTIKSYDVIGFLLDGTSVKLYDTAEVKGTNYSKTYGIPKKFSNGFGYSVLIPNTTNIKVSVSFYVEPKGIVYGSYQHAMKNITEANSKLYTLNMLGAGNVFLFYGAAKDVYDQATGLEFNLP